LKIMGQGKHVIKYINSRTFEVWRGRKTLQSVKFRSLAQYNSWLHAHAVTGLSNRSGGSAEEAELRRTCICVMRSLLSCRICDLSGMVKLTLE